MYVKTLIPPAGARVYLVQKPLTGAHQHSITPLKVTASRNVSAVKTLKTATDRLSDFKISTGDEIKADRDCAVSRSL